MTPRFGAASGAATPWLLVLACVLVACGSGDSRSASATKAAALSDTAPADLSRLNANLPPPSADTLTPVARPRLRVEHLPDAPQALMDAAEREEGISRFCYQEYGQKVDPKLVGAVALVVSVDMNVIQAVRVGAEEWSSPAGRAVNSCLLQKIPQAWKIAPGSRVAEGKYVVQLRFRPS